MSHDSAKQRERRQRGEDFQNEIRESWRQVPNTWRLRIPDGGGGTRPADELVLTANDNLLIEMKRTEGVKFELNMLRPGQVKGLLEFDRVLPNNCGMVFISFLNERENRDEAYAFRLEPAMRWMKRMNTRYVHLEDLQRFSKQRLHLNCVRLPRMENGLYDLREVPGCCKYL